MDNVYSQFEAAGRYDAARSLPPQTKALWLETIKSSLPEDKHDWVCLQPPHVPVRESVDLFVFRKQAELYRCRPAGDEWLVKQN